MARGRIIDKQIHLNEQLSALPIEARFLYLGMVIHADDEGRMKSSPKYLKGLIFPFDEAIRVDTIRQWRDQIAGIGLVKLYAAGGQEYLAHPNWKKWQPLRSDRVHPSDCPSPNSSECKELQIVVEMSTKCQPSDNRMETEPNPTQPNPTQPNPTQPNLKKGIAAFAAGSVETRGDLEILIGHVRNSYKAKKGHDMIFMGKDGNMLKNLLAGSSRFYLMALWDKFMDSPVDWFDKATAKTVRGAHDVKTFVSKITILAEGSDWKGKAAIYERESMGSEQAQNATDLASVTAGIGKQP